MKTGRRQIINQKKDFIDIKLADGRTGLSAYISRPEYSDISFYHQKNLVIRSQSEVLEVIIPANCKLIISREADNNNREIAEGENYTIKRKV